MRVRMQPGSSIQTEAGTVGPGEVVEVTEEVAAALIAGGSALEVEESRPSRAARQKEG